jgi:hypothetical protein
MAPSNTSAQRSLLATFASQPDGQLVHVESVDGEAIVTFAPTKAYQSIAVSSPALSDGVTYAVEVGGSATGTTTSGLVDAGDWTAGQVVATTTTADAARPTGPAGGRAGR